MSMKAICFDMDGLLVETESLWMKSETKVMADMGVTWTQEDQLHCLGGPLARVGQYMVSLAGYGNPTEVVEHLVDTTEMLFRSEPLHWMPGVPELLKAAHAAGIPTALVSASPRRLMNAVLEHVVEDLGSIMFATTVSANDVTRTKPDPQPYLLACLRLQVDPSEVVVLEDSPTGVQAGLAAGAKVVGVPDMATIEPRENLTVIKSIADIDLEWLSRL